MSNKQYWAFISYSSKDNRWGQWLHHRLENYNIPEDFRGQQLFDGSVIGKNLRPIFRDRDELSSSSNLGDAIGKALESSRFLIVLCSKNSAQSDWVNKEIESFINMGKKDNILALILDGEPNATSRGSAEDECFPPTLRYPMEPIAGDLRKESDGKDRGFLKILAGITELDFDQLYRRHERSLARKRLIRTLLISGVSLLFALLSLLTLIKSKEAEHQKNIAIEANKKTNRRTADLYLEEARRELVSGYSDNLAILTTAAYKASPDHPNIPYFLSASYQKWGANRLYIEAHNDMIQTVIYDNSFITTDSSGFIRKWSEKGEMISQNHFKASGISSYCKLNDETWIWGYENGDVVIEQENVISEFADSHIGPIVDIYKTGESGGFISIGLDGTIINWDNNFKHSNLYNGYGIVDSNYFADLNLLSLYSINKQNRLISLIDYSILKLPDSLNNSAIISVGGELYGVDKQAHSIYKLNNEGDEIKITEEFSLSGLGSNIKEIINKEYKIYLLLDDGSLSTVDVRDFTESVIKAGDIKISNIFDFGKYLLLVNDEKTIELLDVDNNDVINRYHLPFSDVNNVSVLNPHIFSITNSSGKIAIYDIDNPFELYNESIKDISSIHKMGEYNLILTANSLVKQSIPNRSNKQIVTFDNNNKYKFSGYFNSNSYIIYSSDDIYLVDIESDEILWQYKKELNDDVFNLITYASVVGDNGILMILSDNYPIGNNPRGKSKVYYKRFRDDEFELITTIGKTFTAIGDEEGLYWQFKTIDGDVYSYSLESGDERHTSSRFVTRIDYKDHRYIHGFSTGQIDIYSRDLGLIGKESTVNSPITELKLETSTIYSGHKNGQLIATNIEDGSQSFLSERSSSVKKIQPIAKDVIVVLFDNGELELIDIKKKQTIWELPYSLKIVDFSYADDYITILTNENKIITFIIRWSDDLVNPPWSGFVDKLQEAFLKNPIVYEAYQYVTESNVIDNNQDSFSNKEIRDKNYLTKIDKDFIKYTNMDLDMFDDERFIYYNGGGACYLYSLKTGDKELLFNVDFPIFNIKKRPNSNDLVVTGFSDDVYIYDLKKREFKELLVGHSARLARIAFNEQDNLLATGGRDGSVIVWDLDNNSQIYQTESLGGYIKNSLSFENELLFFSSYNKSKVLDVSNNVVYDLLEYIDEDDQVVDFIYREDEQIYILITGKGFIKSFEFNDEMTLFSEIDLEIDNISSVTLKDQYLFIEHENNISILKNYEFHKTITLTGSLKTWFVNPANSTVLTIEESNHTIRLWNWNGDIIKQYIHDNEINDYLFIGKSNQLLFMDGEVLYKLDMDRLEPLKITANISENIYDYSGDFSNGKTWGITGNSIDYIHDDKKDTYTDAWDDTFNVESATSINNKQVLVELNNGGENTFNLYDVEENSLTFSFSPEESNRYYISQKGIITYKNSKLTLHSWDNLSISVEVNKVPFSVLPIDSNKVSDCLVFYIDGFAEKISFTNKEIIERPYYLGGRPSAIDFLHSDYLISLDSGIIGKLEISDILTFSPFDRYYNFDKAGEFKGLIWLLFNGELTFVTMSGDLVNNWNFIEQVESVKNEGDSLTIETENYLVDLYK